MNCKIFVSFLCLCAFVMLSSETISGRIIDNKTLQGVPGALIWLQDEEIRAISDGNGLFELKSILPGEYQIHTRHIGFQEHEETVNVPKYDVLIIQLERKSFSISGISITDTRAEERKTPVAVTNISNEKIRGKMQGQDLPLILDEIPGLTSYSESGSCSGYSYIKVRGFDQKRIGIMINGIPLNDPEDHQVYWVDMPDFAESIQDIQFQHGVGASKYSIASLGGSLNIQTSSAQSEGHDELFAQFGSYDSRKYGMKYNALLADDLSLNIRLSRIISDGYRDNSASELSSIYTTLRHTGAKLATEFNFFTGHEITHAAWYASWEGYLAQNHHHNPISYANEIDDFEQPHFELHNFYSIDDATILKNSLFYIKGKGYYEQLKDDAKLSQYGLAAISDTISASIIRQKWVEKNHYGWITSLSHQHALGEFACGTYLSYFTSNHWGEVDDVFDPVNMENFHENFVYHRYLGTKKYLTAYANENFQPLKYLNLQANIHYQYISYDFRQKEAGNFTGEYLNEYEVDYSFFNPQIGLNYNLNRDWNFFGSVAVAHREPADNELYGIWDGPDDLGAAPLFKNAEALYDEDGNICGYDWSDPLVEPEFVLDYETGIGYDSNFLKWSLTAYYMDFKNEIVDYGGFDDDYGTSIRGNADATIHRGIETQLQYYLPFDLRFSGTCAWSDNYFRKFIYNFYGEEIDLTGNQLAGFPQISGQLKLAWDPGIMGCFVQMQHTGKQYLDNTQSNEHIIKAYTVYNLGCNLKLAEIIGKTTIMLQLRLNNAFNLEYETAGYLDDGDGEDDYNDNFYYPAAGRNFTAGIRLSF
ncbi:MAG: TonB-dependent receptor [Candidatus Cloacimonetes bacterium]|nr:TonB-dependent receptor [Candidatus Cloacimonadota bacterium]